MNAQENITYKYTGANNFNIVKNRFTCIYAVQFISNEH